MVGSRHVMLRVFSQGDVAALDLAQLVRNGTRFFDAELNLRDADGFRLAAPLATPASDPAQAHLREPNPSPATVSLSIELEVVARQLRDAFEVRGRLVQTRDLEAAQRAEHRGQSGGMSQLAARCRGVFELTPFQAPIVEATRAGELLLAAVFASVCLGPVLPEDESALFGVRGAVTRYEAIVGACLLRTNRNRS
ncbi:MAG TPA: hypothetical protein VFQ61_39415 [Polyangiaceae bacterium]|nr:hypothetical protein [Polyangiaceae bacterium]